MGLACRGGEATEQGGVSTGCANITLFKDFGGGFWLVLMSSRVVLTSSKGPDKFRRVPKLPNRDETEKL